DPYHRLLEPGCEAWLGRYYFGRFAERHHERAEVHYSSRRSRGDCGPRDYRDATHADYRIYNERLAGQLQPIYHDGGLFDQRQFDPAHRKRSCDDDCLKHRPTRAASTDVELSNTEYANTSVTFLPIFTSGG